MPSPKPRINLTVDDDLNSLLNDVSALTGTPKATLIVNFLKDAKPMLRELKHALELAQEKKNVVPSLARLSAMANAHTSSLNNDMADVYSKQMGSVEDKK